MSKLALVSALGAFLLAGCNAPTEEPNRPLVWRAPPLHAQSIGLATLRAKMAPEVIATAPLQARVVVQEGEGTPSERYTLHSRARMMQLEGDVYVVLAKRGYVRKGVTESAGRFAVDYVHPRDVTISADYAEHAGTGQDEGVKSRLVLSWTL